MISKNKTKQIRSLALKKVRNKSGLFLVEGNKNVLEVLKSDFRVKELIATNSFISENSETTVRAETITEASAEEIKGISLLKQPQQCLAVCVMPPDAQLPENLAGLSLFLDGIQDPGNLGTIIRICDWFGLEYLFCSPDTADIFNPKVVQACMGSFCRIKTAYVAFEDIIRLAVQSDVPVFGTSPEGTNIYAAELPARAIVVLGSEGQGIKTEISRKTSANLMIPSFNSGKVRAESLNVAVSAGIICSEFKRRTIQQWPIQNENKA